MNKFTLPAICIFGALGACSTTQTPVDETSAIPDGVAAMAAPGQDLASARLRPEDNCYWYAYAGPVETTLLPLKTVDGRPICAG